MTDEEINSLRPRVVFVDENNQITEIEEHDLQALSISSPVGLSGRLGAARDSSSSRHRKVRAPMLWLMIGSSLRASPERDVPPIIWKPSCGRFSNECYAYPTLVVCLDVCGLLVLIA